MTWFQRSRAKYGNKTATYNGITYHSMLEAGYAQDLDMRVKAGDIKSWDRQVKIDLLGENGGHIANYFMDFVITHNDGSFEYVECKGFPTEVWRLKWKMAEDKFSTCRNIKLTLVT